MTNNLLKVLFFALLLNSCSNPIEFKGGETKPLLVLNCVVQADSIINVEMSKSVFFLDYSTQNTSVTNADIEVFINENSIGKMQVTTTNSDLSLYSINYAASRGDNIRIEASAPNFDKIWAETTVPAYSTEISNIELLNRVENDSWTDNLRITFKDNPNDKNYYLITAFNTYSNGDVFYNCDIYSNDVIFDEISNTSIFGESRYRIANVFSDDLINGKEYSFVVAVSNNIYSLEHYITFQLHNITKEYYLYLKTIYAAYNNEDFLEIFGEPVQIFNNINGGIGILGSSAISEKRVLVTPMRW